jgi:DNA-directed RNA polymerase subunit N (RpoN/RPB10)
MVALGERFYAVLCRQPGETMTTLAPQVGVHRACCRRGF